MVADPAASAVRGIAWALVLGLAGLAACDDLNPAERPGAGVPTAGSSSFRYTATGDLSGAYVPGPQSRAGTISVVRLSIGQAAAFQAWTPSGGGAAPIRLVVGLAEAGGAIREAHPTRVSISDTRLNFEGTVPGVDGPVSLTVRIDQGALATAKHNLGDDAPVMTGTLSAAGQTAPVSLRWYGGD